MEQSQTSSLSGHRHSLPPGYSGVACLGLTGCHHLFSQNVVDRMLRLYGVAFDLLRLRHRGLPIGVIGSFITNDRPRQASGFVGHGYRGNVAVSAFS
jgi:hypothetical protein